ncbi:MAG: SDR family oxidoreductase [Rhodospirillaceae bacterium]|jgi:3-oxoacyl-[acyl-carrier protein] reductase|nr:SDR family oxidoreductase [Rhodospirillaceae bacterium]MBT6117185.1 SDR family oxidoreductase [Rhodospirillaceae bacterium]
MDLGIKGEGALILAGSQGLGLGCARALLDEGVKVLVTGRNAETGAKAVASLNGGSGGGDAGFIQGDVADADDRARVFAEAEKRLGKVSILVTNAGGPPTGPFLEKSLDEWRTAFDLSLLSAVDMARMATSGMVERGWGRIVNISSISVKETTPNTPLANGLKTAVIGAFGTLAREIADKGVTVNHILPGPFDTALLRRVARDIVQRPDLSEEEAVQEYAKHGPMKRLGTVEEFGSLCAYLCSRKAGYITAQGVAMDGGLVTALY